jgi:hypothetical protein
VYSLSRCRLLPFSGLPPAPGPVRLVHKRPDDSHGVRIIHPPARTYLLPTHTHTYKHTRTHTHTYTYINSLVWVFYIVGVGITPFEAPTPEPGSLPPPRPHLTSRLCPYGNSTEILQPRGPVF